VECDTYNIYCQTVIDSLVLATDTEVRVRLAELPDFLRSSGSGTGSTQPHECN
jgi:hypothetical protein